MELLDQSRDGSEEEDCGMVDEVSEELNDRHSEIQSPGLLLEVDKTPDQALISGSFDSGRDYEDDDDDQDDQGGYSERDPESHQQDTDLRLVEPAIL